MSRYNHKHNLSFKEYLYRILFSAIAIVILVTFLPYGNTSSYHYQQGEPWDEEAFIAQDSFPILKSAEQLAREKDSLRQFYEPYLHQDVEVLEEQMAALRQDFESPSMQGVPQYY